MAKDKKSFVLYCDIIHTIEQLTDEQAGHLFKHVLYYVNDLKNACERIPNDAKNADNDNDNDNDINIVLEQKAKKPKRFTKPPVDDVRQYMAELNMNDMSQRFVDYYESNGWKVGKNPMKDWKAAVRTWKQQNNDKQPKQESFYKPLKFD
jgi:hypothetical protein